MTFISVQQSPLPNLMDIYPDVNQTIFESHLYPTLDLVTIETFTSDHQTSDENKKRIVKRHNLRHDCVIKTSIISIKDLGLNKLIVYPLTFQTVFCEEQCQDEVRNITLN